jgi:hypothetical protein
MILLLMPIPEAISAESLIRYVGGKCLATGRGDAWREIKASVIALPQVRRRVAHALVGGLRSNPRFRVRSQQVEQDRVRSYAERGAK